MTINNKEIHVDIGGGKEGQFLQSKAASNPNITYLSLDPEACTSQIDLLNNLRLIKWEASELPILPFQNRSIDSVYMNFLYGTGGIEWKTDLWTPNLLSGEQEDLRKQPLDVSNYFYRKILDEVKRVLKFKGQLYISDVKGNMGEILTNLKLEGFKPGRPNLVSNIKQSQYSEVFYEASKINPEFNPTEVTAKLK